MIHGLIPTVKDGWRCEWCNGPETEQVWHYDQDGCHEICGPCHDSVKWKDGQPIRLSSTTLKISSFFDG